MVKCVVSSCSNRQVPTSNRGGLGRAPKRFFSFPKDPARIRVWLAALREPDKQDWSENHVICEDHFLPEDLTSHGVSPDAIPIMPPCLEEGLGLNAWPEDPEEDDQWAAEDAEEEEEAPTPVFAQRVPATPVAPPADESIEAAPEPPRPSVTPKQKPQQRLPPPSAQDPASKTLRQDVSLHLLTRRFLELLLNSEGSLDLRGAAESLQTRKRRIYDVTNILEGINVIQRDSTSKVRWIGKCPISSFLWNQQKMKSEYEKLKLVEETLDGLIKSCAQQLFNMTDDQGNARSAYVTFSDVQLLSAFKDQTVVVVQAPEETKLEVPAPKEDSIQIHLKSSRGQIRAVTCEVWPDVLRIDQSLFLQLENSRINTRPLQTESSSSQSTLPSL